MLVDNVELVETSRQTNAADSTEDEHPNFVLNKTGTQRHQAQQGGADDEGGFWAIHIADSTTLNQVIRGK